jgi:hypothetical protein
MAAPQAAFRGKHTKLFRETDTPGTYEEVTAIRGLTPPRGTKDRIESTTLDSDAREYIGGEPDFGNATFRQLMQDTPMFAALEDDFATSTVRQWRIDYTTGQSQTFSGYVAERGVPEVAFDGVLEVETVITCSGFPTWA